MNAPLSSYDMIKMAAPRGFSSCFALQIAVFIAAGCVAVSGEYVVLHAPSHVQFLPEAAPLKTSEIPALISNTYGLQVQQEMTWDGLGAGNVFKRPKANVLVSVDSLPQSSLSVNHRAVYKTQQDDVDVNTSPVVSHLESTSESPLIVDFSIDTTILELRSHHPHLFSDLPTTFSRIRDVFLSGQHGWSLAQMGALNYTKDSDLLFLGELYVIKSIAHTLSGRSEVGGGRSADFYHLRVSGLRGLVREYGADSQQVHDALDLLSTVLDQMTSDFKKLYSGNVVVQVVGFEGTGDLMKGPSVAVAETEPLHRQGRSLLQNTEDEEEDYSFPYIIEHLLCFQKSDAKELRKTLGLAPQYTNQYPIVFNMLLWVLVVIAIALFAISYGIWGMDPGRDSIIYRMTSQRMKKE